jgi:hypothetical protein
MSHPRCLCRSDGMQLTSVRLVTPVVGIKKTKVQSLSWQCRFFGAAASFCEPTGPRPNLICRHARGHTLGFGTGGHLEDVGDLLCPEGVCDNQFA